MGLILNRDDLVKLLQEDEEMRDLIRQIALGQPEEGEAHEVPEAPEVPASLKVLEPLKEAVYIAKKEELSSKKQELRQKLEEARKDRDLWKQAAQQAAAEKEAAVLERDRAINERDAAVYERNQAVQERDAMADQLKQAVREKEQAFRAMEESDRLRNQAVRAMEESNHKVEEARRIVSKLQAEITFLQERLGEAKGTISSLTADLDHTREEREDLKDDLQQAEQELAQRFVQGWQLYEAYQDVDDYYKDLLDGVLARPGFEAFIVGLSQDRSLRTLWDVTREAVMKSRDEAAGKILWNLFCYSLDLVNRSRSENLYAVEDVEVGDPYDIDRHALTGDSRSQGCLSKVFLAGYRNVSTDKIVCKSQVKI